MRLKAVTSVLYAGLVAIALIQARVVQSYWTESGTKPAFADRWDPQVMDLAFYIRRQLKQVDKVLVVDYGVGLQIRALVPLHVRKKIYDECFYFDDQASNSAARESFYWRYCNGNRILVVFTSMGPSIGRSRDAFLDLIKEHGRTVVPLKRWEKPTGQMLYTVLLLR